MIACIGNCDAGGAPPDDPAALQVEAAAGGHLLPWVEAANERAGEIGVLALRRRHKANTWRCILLLLPLLLMILLLSLYLSRTARAPRRTTSSGVSTSKQTGNAPSGPAYHVTHRRSGHLPRNLLHLPTPTADASHALERR